MSSPSPSVDRLMGEHHIRFVEKITSGDVVLMRFKDPAPGYAVTMHTPSTEVGNIAAHAIGDTLDVVLVPPLQAGLAEWLVETNDPDAIPPVYVKYRGVELLWRPGRAILQCDAEQAESLLSAVVEFAHYERELRRLEDEVAAAWVDLDEDRPLAFDVTTASLRRSEVVGERMEQTLRRRMRLARIESHLYSPDPKLTTAAQKLGEELREKGRTEARTEIVDGQIEVFEHIYEMSSQRMGEYRAARQGHIMEWVIIVLLAAEALLMLAQTISKTRT